MVTNAIDRATSEAKKQGLDSYGVSVGFTNGADGISSLTVKFDAEAIDKLKATGANYIAVNTGTFQFTLDKDAISQIDKVTTGIVTIDAKPVAALSNSAKKLIGARPVFDITIKDSKGNKVTNLDDGNITLGIRYTPSSTERTGNLYAAGRHYQRQGQQTV